MNTRGRVLDPERRPAAGATVTLGYYFAPEATDDDLAPGADRLPLVAITDEQGAYCFALSEFPETGRKLRLRADDNLAVRARCGSLCSWSVRFPWNGRPVRAPDIVLEPGVHGCTAVRWDDDTPAAGVDMEISVCDEVETLDENNRILTFGGSTDDGGQFTYGPVPGRPLRMLLQANLTAGPPLVDDWTARPDDSRTLVLTRGRSSRGRLVDATGEPAVGYRVAPWWFHGGDPDAKRTSPTGADGSFVVDGLDPSDMTVAVYDRLAETPSLHALAESEDRAELMRAAMRVASAHFGLGAPLAYFAVPGEDAGTLTLPHVGPFRVRLRGTLGGTPRSASLFWHHSGRSHGGSSFSADGDGVVTVERMPMGTEVDLEVTIEDSVHGTLVQKFPCVTMRDEPVTLRVTGAGALVVRARTHDAPETPLPVRELRICWDGG
ncbi:MAG: carboxypeptidase-like regulatory domain-containing protein [Planctomycetota bacterium]|nr:carboxypeptidase-like regulatory domain-containing protein [Planctomycetota bacterium]